MGVMRILGLQILRVKNHEQIMKSRKEAMATAAKATADLNSATRTITQHEQTIEALKAKCSLVNVSALENEVRRLRNEKMPGAELQVSDKLEPLVLPSALVQPSTGVEERRTGYRPEPGEGFDLTSE
jgi:hypothetical protein